MDIAQQIEHHARRHHKFMDELIDRGDSPVQQFYRDTTVFVTGGSGFLGKQLIEKLIRSCTIKKVYLLTRPKQGKTIQARLDRMLKEPIFDRVHEKQPDFGQKIVPVEGDVQNIRLGLSNEDWKTLTEEVEIIFHVAATIRFDEPLSKATLTNVRGTREALTLAKQCSKLKIFVHVSTIFSHATNDRINTDIDEQFYPCPVNPNIMIALAEELDKKKIDSITKNLKQGWPNTYTFTKAMAEDLVRISADDIPVCVVRPAVVLSSYFEPNPGWVDTNSILGPSGLLLGALMGVVRVFLTDVNSNLVVSPVDYVNNATIAAAWDCKERRENGDTNVTVYNVGRDLRYGLIGEIMRLNKKKMHSLYAIWYANVFETKSKYLYFFLSWFYHFIPAYIIDIVTKVLRIKMPKEIPSVVAVYKIIDKFAAIYNYFVFNQWQFNDKNIKSMIGNMSDADKIIFNCNLYNIDYNEFIQIWSIGLRKYIIKDGLQNTEAANRNQRIFYYLQFVVLVLYLYIAWFMFSKVCMVFQ